MSTDRSPTTSLRATGRGPVPAAVLGVVSVAGGGATAALIQYGRPSLPLISLQWLEFAAVVGAGLVALFALQATLIRVVARRATTAALRATAYAFTPLLLLWPLVLGVTFWDTANHLFVFHPGVGLWWGGVGFGFAVVQVALIPIQLDGGGASIGRWVRTLPVAVRAAWREPAASLALVATVFVVMRLVMLFAFDTAARIDPKPAYDGSYALATLTDQGVYPYLGRWSEYPPGFPWLSSGVYRAVSFFGVTFDRYALAVTLVMLVFAVLNLILVHRLARAVWGESRALTAAWLYTALAFPIHEWLRTFTPLSVFFLLLATWLAIEKRPHTAALAAVLGGLVKAFPLVALVTVLRFARSSRERLGATAVATGVGLAVVIPLWAVGGQWFTASVSNMGARPAWQTIWALLDGNLAQGWVNPYRLSPDSATAFAFDGRLPGWIWPALNVATVATLAALLVRPRLPDDARSRVQLTLLAVVVFALGLKGWSPGFVNWFFPLILVLWPTFPGFVLVAALGSLELFWRSAASGLGDPAWATYAAVALRTAVFVGLAAWLVRELRRASTQPSTPTRPVAGVQLDE